ncbi:NADH-quinone oxidoreductase subunit N [Nocardioides zeae]|uniref:NADH-quinone oxidoreductase subunit N n=1 Tax=Nocardioides zeae TaxID=1457234 RepID=A0ACC6IMU6_9ACTN|nr:NADH-quinone oxidoreductase subunit NuoN [Nocardioides zeae]MDR6173764.1 NADH-quinone oxidoreductase subunit N [Nocardioides zeae]MDR6211948.1 NADH-quinone oxidoreductase subunit N [Nocardioides zeae]
MEFTAPEIDWLLVSPLLAVFAAALVGIAVEAFTPRSLRRPVQAGITAVGLLTALVLTVVVALELPSQGGGAAHGDVTLAGAVVVDGPAVFLWGLLAVVAVGGLALFTERRVDAGLPVFAGQASVPPGADLGGGPGIGTGGAGEATGDGGAPASYDRWEHTEVYPLLTFAVAGMMLFAAAGDLLTMFVALEILSLPLYLLCGLGRRRRLLSQESAMKYFLLGAFSSGFFVYGAALLYGYSGTLSLAGIAAAVGAGGGPTVLLLAGVALVMVALLFKVGAVPFHAWTPDVYQGAPTPVTAFMAAATKIAAFGAVLRFLYVAVGDARWDWAPLVWVVAILTMLGGVVLAVGQSDIKRLLAYSSIAHTGFLLTGVLGLQGAGELGVDQVSSLQAVLFYLATYGVATVGIFAVTTLVRDAGGEASGVDRWSGVGRTSPLVAGAFAVFLLSLAGIPLTSGFVAKWSVFASAAGAGAWPVVAVAITSSIVAVYFYVRHIVTMFFADPPADPPAVVSPSPATSVTIGVALLATVVLGVVPGPLLELAGDAGSFLR